MSRRPPLPPSFPPRDAGRAGIEVADRDSGVEVVGRDVGVEELAEAAVDDRVSDRLVDRLEERRRARRRLRVRALVLWVVAALVVCGAAYVVLASPLLALRADDVELQGTDEIAPAEDVLEVVEPFDGVPLLRLDTPAIRAELLELPGVLDATVRRDFPHGLIVTVVPRTPVATVEEDGGFVVLDAEGVELARDDEPREGIPVVAVPVGSDATAEALTAVLTAMDALPADLLEQVAEVSAATAYEVTFELDSGAQVVWGSAEDSDLKAAVLADLLQVPASVYDVSAPLSPITR